MGGRAPLVFDPRKLLCGVCFNRLVRLCVFDSSSKRAIISQRNVIRLVILMETSIFCGLRTELLIGRFTCSGFRNVVRSCCRH
jgi:hypothetical protein